MSRFRLVKTGVIIKVATALIGCNPHEPGRATLEYVSTSESEAAFILDNRDAQALTILGSRSSTSGIDVYRAEYSMSCKKDSESDEEPDGFSDPPAFAEIQPGDRVRLTVHTGLTQRFKGGRCQLSLVLLNGPTHSIKSNEFVP